jgi:hypothetical protein
MPKNGRRWFSELSARRWFSKPAARWRVLAEEKISLSNASASYCRQEELTQVELVFGTSKSKVQIMQITLKVTTGFKK